MALEDFLSTGLGIAGGAAGASIGGPAGAQLGSTLGSSVGKLFASGIKDKRAKASLPEREDPLQRGFLDEINALRSQFETGSAYNRQIRQLKNIEAATQSGLIKAAGGGTGALISGLARAGRGTQEAYGDIAAAGDARADNLLEMAIGQGDKIVQRKAELDLMQYGQEAGDSAQLFKGGEEQINKLIGSGTINDIFNKKSKGASFTSPRST